MDIESILNPERVFGSLQASSKKRAIELAADKIAASLPEADTGTIYRNLIEREKLGTTGVGMGIAIPHGKLPGLERLHGMFARLEQPIDFEAIDEQPVDLIFLLLAPESAGADHLKALAKVSRLLRDETICEKLRRLSSAKEIHALLTTAPASNAA